MDLKAKKVVTGVKSKLIVGLNSLRSVANPILKVTPVYLSGKFRNNRTTYCLA